MDDLQRSLDFLLERVRESSSFLKIRTQRIRKEVRHREGSFMERSLSGDDD